MSHLFHAFVSAQWLMRSMRRGYFYLCLSRSCPNLLHTLISRGASQALLKTKEGDTAMWLCRGLHLQVYFRPYTPSSLGWFSALSNAFSLLLQNLEELDTSGRTPRKLAELQPVESNSWITWGLAWNWESGAYLHESELKLILQASWYDYKTGQDHERVSVQVPQATEMQ